MNKSSTGNITANGPWPFMNAKNGSQYSLIRADQVSEDEKCHERLVRICNEPLIYDFLFRNFLQGEPYALANAKSFLARARRGWQEQSNFVFLSIDSQGEICGATDIKSNDRKRAEIGYWATENHSGITTPAVGALCSIASDSGFECLFAYVKTTNPRSIAVLERNGFQKDSTVDQNKGYPRFLFNRTFI